MLLQGFDDATGLRPLIEPLDAFVTDGIGEIILVVSRTSLAGELAAFDFSWFIPSFVKYRRLLGEVLLVSLFLQLFALVTPLFVHVVMDRVLVHREQPRWTCWWSWSCSKACSMRCAATSLATLPAASTWSWAAGPTAT